VGEISPQTMTNIRRVFLGVVRRDFDDVVLALQRLGFFTRDVDILAVKRALVWGVDTFYEMSLGELQTVNPFDVLDRVQDILYSESFQIPANFAFLGRALGTLSGLCTALDPSFQFVSVAEPYARSLVQGQTGFRGMISQVAGEARSLAVTAYSLPYLSRHALQRMQESEMGVRHELSELGRAAERVERAVRRILYAMLLTGFLLTGALVFPTRYAIFSLIAFGIAFVLLLYLVVSIGRRR
jgi:predicted unusual protein kinase regulating ubiquinone biosynthesis (AarF/ABC1/UbiB family)